MDSTYVLASSSGLMTGFLIFLLISAAIASGIYALLTRPSTRRRELGLKGTVRKSIAVPTALAIFAGILAAFYLTSLSGFHAVTVGDDDIRMDYALPPGRLVTLRYADISEVVPRPAYKLLWRLEIMTRTGERLTSAPGSSRETNAAAEDIERRRVNGESN